MERLVDWCQAEAPCLSADNQLHTELRRDVHVICEALAGSPNEGDSAATESSDSIANLLVRISALTRFMEATKCCSGVQALQQSIPSTVGLVQALVQLLGHSRHLVRYSSCKLLSALLMQDVDINRKLKHLVRINTEYISTEVVMPESENYDSHQYHRLTMTFDLLRLLLKHFDTHSEDSMKVPPVCTCDRIGTSEKVDRRAAVVGAAKLLSCMIAVFRSLLSRPGPSLQDDDRNHCQYSSFLWMRNLSLSKMDVLFTAYLKLLKSVLKRMGRRSELGRQREVVNFLVDVMAEYRVNRIPLKLAIDIVTRFLQTEVKACKEPSDSDLGGFLTQTSSRLCELCTEEWLQRLPYHDGPVGFGGVHFMEIRGSDQKTGDGVLLQKLTRTVLVAAVILTDQCQKGSDFQKSVSSSIHHLRKYVTLKKKGTFFLMESNPVGWLWDLFEEDDDDQLVAILLHTLNLYSNIKKNFESDITNGWGSDIHNQLLKMFNPHVMFQNYLKLIEHDHSVLLDLLMSSETEFLEYLTCYLHLLKSEWNEAKAAFRQLHEPEPLAKTPRGTSPEVKLCELGGKGNLGKHVESGQPGFNHPTISEFTGNRRGAEKCVGGPLKREAQDWGTGERDGQKTVCQVLPSDIIGRVTSTEGDGILGESQYSITQAIEADERVDINHGLDEVFTVLIRLRISLERLNGRDMFPYSITPLINLLEELERCYEA